MIRMPSWFSTRLLYPRLPLLLCRTLLLCAVVLAPACGPKLLASPAATLPPPGGSTRISSRATRSESRQRAADNADARPTDSRTAANGDELPIIGAPLANDEPEMRYTIIAPEGKPVGPVPKVRPRDDSELSEAQRQYTSWAYDVLASLRFRKGEQALADGVAKVNPGAGYEYLNSEDATRVLNEVWGNPDGAAVLGMITPEHQTPFDANSWGIVLRFDAIGHVADGARERSDFPALITPLKAQAERLNVARAAAGYPKAEILGWASLPHYDLARHVLQWSTILQIEGNQARTLNYEVRLLGRRGVLSLSIVANANQFPEIQQQIPTIVDMVRWRPDADYDAYNEDVDMRAVGELDSLITRLPPAEKSTRDSPWWLLLLLPVGAITFWLRKHIANGQAAQHGPAGRAPTAHRPG